MESTIGVEELLTTNGLGKYAPSFKLHAIDNDVLFDITHEDLEHMGIQSLGHRILILKMIDARRPLSSAMYTPMQRPQLATIVPPGRKSASGSGAAGAAAAASSVASISSFEPLGPRETAMLRERLENSEKHIRKLSEQIARLRAELFRKFKESEPLPTPTGRNFSPGSTPGLASAHSKRSPSDSYFQQRHSNSSGSAVASPSAATPSSSNNHVFHGHWSGTPSGVSSTTSSYFQSPLHSGSAGGGGGTATGTGGSNTGGTTSSHSLTPLPQGTTPNQATGPSKPVGTTSNLLISNPSDSFKNFRCTEKDNVHKVMSALLQRKYLDGDLSQWRLQIQYGDKSRELLDHEFPLVVFKQLQDQGHRPIFNMKQIQPHKPPDGTYI